MFAAMVTWPWYTKSTKAPTTALSTSSSRKVRRAGVGSVAWLRSHRIMRRMTGETSACACQQQRVRYFGCYENKNLRDV